MTTQAARRLRSQLAAHAELGWLRFLDEVGEPITRQLDDYQRLHEEYLAAADRVDAIRFELEALRTHAQLLVDAEWSPAEQAEAKVAAQQAVDRDWAARK